MEREIMTYVISIQLQFHFQLQFQCRRANAEVYKWPLFNQHLKNKSKLIKENSIPSGRASPLVRVHTENFHLA